MALVSHKELLKTTICLENSIIDSYSCGLAEHGMYISTFQCGYVNYEIMNDLNVTMPIFKSLLKKLLLFFNNCYTC